MICLDIEMARQSLEGIKEWLERLREDEDPGEEGLSLAEIDDAVKLVEVLQLVLRKR